MKKLTFWAVVLVLTSALVYLNLFATPPAGTNYTEPEETLEQLNEDGNVEAYVDTITEQDYRFCLFQVSGWAYQPSGKTVNSREVFLVFQPLSDSGIQYTFSCGELKGRSDVAERTDGITPPDPDTVGFDNITISAKNMEKGRYLLYFYVVEDGVAASTKTEVVLERTADGATIGSAT